MELKWLDFRSIVFIAALSACSALAGPAPRDPIVIFVDPSENPDLTIYEQTKIVDRWLFCTECAPTSIHLVANFGNKILPNLSKAFNSDERYLSLSERSQTYGDIYDEIAKHLTRPSSKSAFIKTEIDKLKRRVKARAEAVLIEIGTPEALAILGPVGRGRRDP